MAEENNKKHNEEDKLMLSSRMSFGDHLEELRTRILRSLAGLGVAFVVCLFLGKYIFIFIAKPLVIALQASGLPPQLYVTSLPETFITYIKVALYTGIFLSSPWIFYQLWSFVAAGLYARERRYVHMFAPFAAIMFILGGAFFLGVVAPLSCNFFIRFGRHITAPMVEENFITRALGIGTEKETAPPANSANQPEETTPPTAGSDSPPEKQPTADPLQTPSPPAQIQPTGTQPLIKPWFTLQSYVSLMIILALAFSLAFQMPLAVFFLGRLGLVTLPALRSARKYVFFGILIVSAIMTPPDVISQIALALPMYVLYELGILLLMIWPKKKHD